MFRHITRAACIITGFMPVGRRPEAVAAQIQDETPEPQLPATHKLITVNESMYQLGDQLLATGDTVIDIDGCTFTMQRRDGSTFQLVFSAWGMEQVVLRPIRNLAA